LTCLSDLEHLVLSETDDNVFWLEVSMDDLAHAMHVVKSNEALAGQFSYKRERDTLIIIALDNLEKVHTEDFEDHNEMLAIGTMMNEGIEKLHTVRCVSTHAILLKALLELRIITIKTFNRLLPFL